MASTPAPSHPAQVHTPSEAQAPYANHPVEAPRGASLIVLLAIGGVVALVTFVGMGVSLAALFSGPRWGSSPMADSFAPVSRDPFKLAIYTIQLMQFVESETLETRLDRAPLPGTLEAMAAAGLIEERMAYDGWGKAMEFDPSSRTISSAGRDGDWGTEDDIVHTFDSGDIALPAPYWAKEGSYERIAQERLLAESVQILQASIQLQTTGIQALESMRNSGDASPGYPFEIEDP